MKVSKNGNLYWRDYGDTSQMHYNVFALVHKVWATYGITNSYLQTLKIASEVARGLYLPPSLECMSPLFIKDISDVQKRVSNNIAGNRDSFIKPSYVVRYSGNRIAYYTYWVARHISTHVVHAFDVRILDTLHRGSRQVYTFRQNDPAFLYPVEEKVYRPYAKSRYKFRRLSSNNPVVFGWSLLGLHQDKIYLVTSRKDAMTLRTAGLASLWVSSEGEWHLFCEYGYYIESRCNEVVIVMDNDKAGRNAAFNIQKHKPWEAIYMPTGKDPDGFIFQTRGDYRSLRRILKATDQLQVPEPRKFKG